MKLKNIAISIVTASILSISTALAVEENASKRDAEIIEFSKQLLKKFENEVFSLKEARVVNKISIPEAPDFIAYIVEFDLLVSDGVSMQSKKITDIFFVSNDGLVSPQLFNIKGEDLKDKLKMNIDSTLFYSQDKLLFGDGSGSKKMLVFSDPFCGFCREAFIKIEEKAKENKIDVYLSHFPIEAIHPSSKIISAILLQGKRKGMGGLAIRAYKTDLGGKLATASDIDEIIAEAERVLGYKASKEDLLNVDIPLLEKEIEEAKKLGVSGTPTIFIDGVKQKSI